MTRYSAEQLADAVLRSNRGGDARDFLLRALISLPGTDAELVTRRLVTDADLQAREWYTLLLELADRCPDEFVATAVRDGLRSRSIEVQQTAMIFLPGWAARGALDDSLIEIVVNWLDKRMRNPRRAANCALWEVPSVALAVYHCRGAQSAYEIMAAHEGRMVLEEQTVFSTLPPPGAADFHDSLLRWQNEQGGAEGSAIDEDYDDPTATRYIDRVMRRLRIQPADPDVETFVEPWET